MSDPIDRLNAALEGRYRIERELGEGGMATVYLADDLRHERKVALKVLKPELAAVVGAERFLAEIKTTANLQHPHILPLHDSGEADGFLFYVMPYVDGETLRVRLDREHQLPVDDAVRVATNIAEALDYAHRQGVIHRDIKPANVLLQDGKPVISDFGIALAVGAAGGGRLTETGLSLGTPHYMSPEQATGDQKIGSAADTYALGCVLYEMLVGDPPFTGSTAQAILGKIITGELPSATAHRPSVPAHVDAAVRRALEKLPADRFGSARGFAAALADPGFRHRERADVAANRTAAYPTRTVATLAATTVVLAAVALWAWLGTAPGSISEVPRYLSISLPDDHRVGVAFVRSQPLAISRDGGTVAYVGESDSGTGLYIRRLDDFEPRRLEDTDGALQPFFSPDGQEVAYFTRRGLYRVRIEGGVPQQIARIPMTVSEDTTSGPAEEVQDVPMGGAWGPDDTIVFATVTSLWRVDLRSGAPEPIPLPGDGSPSWPSFLPPGAGGGAESLVMVGVGPEFFAVSVGDGEARALDVAGVTTFPQLGHAQYVPGFLVITRTDGGVEAAPFDLASLETTGPWVAVLDNVLRANLTDATVLATSANGTLVFVPGASERRLVLVDREGRERFAPMEPGDYRFPALSWDGVWVAFDDRLREPQTVLLNLETGQVSSLRAFGPTWRYDGLQLTGAGTVLEARAPGPGAVPDTIGDVSVLGLGSLFPWQWHPDGIVLLRHLDGDSIDAGGFYTLHTEDGTIERLVDTEASEYEGARSRDGRWFAYESDASGQREIYVRAFPAGDDYQVSIDGGETPRWSADGSELFYLKGEQVFAVDMSRVERGGPFEPELLFRRSYVTMLGRPWDVRPNGEFIMLSAGARFLRDIRVVTNWVEELRATVGGG